MKRIKKCILIYCVVFLSFAGMFSIGYAEPPEIKFVGVYNDYPYCFINEKGESDGMVVETVKELCNTLGYSLEVKLFSREEARQRFDQSGDILYHPDMTKAEKEMYSATAIAADEYGFVVADNSIYTARTNATIIEKLNRNKKYRWGLLDDGDVEICQELRPFREQMVVLDSYSGVLEQLDQNKIQVAVLPKNQVKSILYETKDEVIVMNEMLFTKERLVYLKKTGYKEAIETELKEMKNSGKLSEIYTRRLIGERLDPIPIRFARIVSGFLVVLGFAVMALVVWNKLLRNRVAEKTLTIEAVMKHNQELYENLLGRERHKQDYYLSLSHELRTPLNVILSSLNLLEQTHSKELGEEETKIQKVFYLIKSNSYRLLRVINNLIEMNKLDGETMTLFPEKADLQEKTQNIIKVVKPWFDKKEIELIYETHEKKLETVCDVEMFEKMILNLLSNALKFTPYGGAVVVRAVRNKTTGDIVMSVKDSGPGIAKENQKSIFEKFIHLQNDLARDAEGNGLGLAIVKGYAELHHGSVQVISKIGSGAEFRLRIPAETGLEPKISSSTMLKESIEHRAMTEMAEQFYEEITSTKFDKIRQNSTNN